ncbi:hypothetical protein ACQZV8_17500, partial [Magnetococcales bacterium HHB-1]
NTIFDSQNGTIDIENGKALTISNGTTIIGDKTTFIGSGRVNLTGTHTLELTSDYTYDSTARLSFGNASVTLNGNNATFTLASGAKLGLVSETINTALRNLGTIYVNSGASSIINGNFSNESSGVLDIGYSGSTSRITITNGFTNSGTIILDDNDTYHRTVDLKVTNGVLINDHIIQSADTSGGGSDNQITARITNRGTLDIDHDLIIYNSNKIFDTQDGTIDIADGQTLTISSGTTIIGSEATLSNSDNGKGFLKLTGTHTLNLATDYTYNGDGIKLSFAGGDVTINNHTFTIASGAILGLVDETFNANLTNQGILRINAGATSFIHGTFYNATDATLDIGASGSTSRLTIASSFINDGLIILDDNDTYHRTTALKLTSGTLTNNGTIQSSDTSGGGSDNEITANIINHGTLSVDSNLILYNNGRIFDSSHGTLNIASGKKLTISSGTTRFGGETTFSGGGRIELTGTHTLSLSDHYLYSGNGVTLALKGDVTINNYSFTIDNDTTLVMASDTFNADLINQGLIRVNAGGSSLFNAYFVNRTEGTLDIGSSGSTTRLIIAHGFSNQGEIILDDNDTYHRTVALEVTSGVLNNTGVISSTDQSGGNSDNQITASIINSGTINVSSNLIIYNANRTFDSRSGSLDIASGKILTLSDGTTILGTDTTFNSSGGYLKLSGTHNLQLASDFNYDGNTKLLFSGAVTVNSNQMTIANGASLTLSEDIFNANLINYGNITIKAGGTSKINGSFSNLADANLKIGSSGSTTTLTIAKGFTNSGVITLDDIDTYTRNVTLNVTEGTLINTGTIQTTDQSGGGSTLRLNANLDNRGTLDIDHHLTINKAEADFINSGTIDIAANKTLTWQGGTLTNTVDGTIQGSGRMVTTGLDDFINNGIFTVGNSPGEMHITGDIRFGSSSTLIMEIEGNTVGVDHDYLDVDGKMALSGGTLEIVTAPDYTPDLGKKIKLIEFDQLEGEFDTITGLQITPYRMWVPTFSANDLTLENREISHLGDDASNILSGDQEDNLIYGSLGDDILTGHGGADDLFGGDGADIFRYVAENDSANNTIDRIFNFDPNMDKVDLSALLMDDDLIYIGAQDFSASSIHSANQKQIQARFDDDDNLLLIDTNDDDEADMQIYLASIDSDQLNQSNFIDTPTSLM